MLEQYLGKRIQIFVEIDERTILYTGQITKETETHFEFTDKYGQNLLINKNNLQQIKEAPK